MEKNIGKCMLLIYNSETKENEWIKGEAIREMSSDSNDSFSFRYDVKTENGIYYGCSPECINQ